MATDAATEMRQQSEEKFLGLIDDVQVLETELKTLKADIPE